MTNQQKWKSDPTLYACPTEKNEYQITKKMDYDTIYRHEFLDSDPLQDWPSIERCKWLWEWSLEQIKEWNPNKGYDPVDISNWNVLDVGTKDAVFPEWLREQSVMSIGLEYSEPYVRYAINKGRPTQYGNACNMPFDDEVFDYVFAHHLHGLLPDYFKGLQEMYRVTRRYMIALNQVPGNPRKHYSYIDSPQIYHDFVESVDCEVIYNDYLDTGYRNEWVILLKKNLAPKTDKKDNLDYINKSTTKIEIEEGYPEEWEVFKKKKENPFF